MVASPFGLSPHTDEWPDRYARDLTRTAIQSARALDLSYQVLECVARGELAPATVDRTLHVFAQTRGEAFAQRLVEVASRFVYGLRDAMTVSGSDAGDADGSGIRPPADVFRPLTRLYADLIGGIGDLRAREIEGCLHALLAAAATPARDASRALALTAPLGSTASASLVVENSGTDRVQIQCAATELRRADGIGPAFTPLLALAPEEHTLEPGQEGHVRASLRLDAAIYETGVLYVGALRVLQHNRRQVEVPVHVTATEASR